MGPSSATQRRNKGGNSLVGGSGSGKSSSKSLNVTSSAGSVVVPLAAASASSATLAGHLQQEQNSLSTGGPVLGTSALSSTASAMKSSASAPPPTAVSVATVRRRFCGTSPFDKHWLNLDCCGLFCALLTYALLGYGCYAVCHVLIPPWMTQVDIDGSRRLSMWGKIHCVAFYSFALMATISHFRAMTTDPGAVPPDAAPIPVPGEEQTRAGAQTSVETHSLLPDPNTANGVTTTSSTQRPPARARKLCRRCNAYKPKRAHHCSICRRCIIKMDHHCPWVNNCVGIGNHKFFLLFIFYTCITCLYSLALLVGRFVVCMNMTRGRCLDRPTDLLPLIGLVTEAMLFCIFTSCMMIDQWDVVMTNVTHIDRLKGDAFLDDVEQATGVGVNEVFGSKQGGDGFRMDWLSPFVKVCFPASVTDEIMGFCSPCMGGSMSKKRDTEMSSLRARRSTNSEIV